jgi:hypothetical protein
MNRRFVVNPAPVNHRDYEDDIAVYGPEAALEKLYLETSLREIDGLDETRCTSTSGVWFAVVFLKCDYPDEVLEDTARDLLRVTDRELRASVCRRFVNALGERRDREVVERIREMLP